MRTPASIIRQHTAQSCGRPSGAPARGMDSFVVWGQADHAPAALRVIRIWPPVRPVPEPDSRIAEALDRDPRLLWRRVADYHDLEVLVRLREHRGDCALPHQVIVL